MVVQIPFIHLKFANIIDINCRRGLNKYSNVSRQLSIAALKGVAPLRLIANVPGIVYCVAAAFV